MKIPAYVILRIIALCLAVLGLFFFTLLFTHTAPYLGTGWLITVSLLILIALLGPVRIIKQSVQIPTEIRQNVLLHAYLLPMYGGLIIICALAQWDSLAYAISGLAAFISSLAGFYLLSNKLPKQLYIDEMLTVIKSASLTGNKDNSIANKEFMRWSGGLRSGVAVGEKAPDGMIITMDGQTLLLSSLLAKHSSEFVVLNFASYTCPIHRKRIPKLHQLVDKWSDRNIKFLTIYTAEAHAEDAWKLEHQYDSDKEFTNDTEFCFKHTTTIDERLKMAQWLIDKKDFKMQVVVDSMDNTLLKAYNSWPIRLYILNAGKIEYCGEQGPFGYYLDRLDERLEVLLG